MTLHELLLKASTLGGSDLHLAAGSPPAVRVDGRLAPLEGGALNADDTRRLACSVLSDGQRAQLEDALELDLSLEIDGVGRVRCSLFHQRGAVGAVYRLIPGHVKPLEELGLPPVLATLAARPRGLVLITGATGSGKSTTLAAVIDRINRHRPGHILTIEDPIEFVHPHRRSVVNQREVHRDTHGFAHALRAALREDPDVVLIGEMRDLESVESALRIAETGHLTLATLHTNSAAQTVHRIIDVFPAHQQGQIRTQLSLVLEGIVCQTLVPRIGGGRVAALEVLIPTPAIRNLIRDGKIHQIHSAMQTGQEKNGMQTMNQSLAALCLRHVIARDEAISASSSPEELQDILNRRAGGGVVPLAGREGRTGGPAGPARG